MVCTWCHVAPSEIVRRSAENLQVETQLRCEQASCRKSSPVLHWNLKGQVAELARASDEALAELSRLNPALRRYLQARPGKAARDVPALLPGDHGRAANFLESWAERNIRPMNNSCDTEVSRLLVELLNAWYHSGIPGPAFMRAAGGDLRIFVEGALKRAR
jgi:hypothetical protein